MKNPVPKETGFFVSLNNMALISCPECNKQISSSSVNCIGCGYPINSAGQPKQHSSSSDLRNCPDCAGRGEIRASCFMCDGSGEDTCPACNGEGKIYVGQGFTQIRCDNCHGTRKVRCNHCNGSASEMVGCSTCKGAGQMTIAEFDQVKKKKAEDEKERQHQAEEHKRAVEAAQAKYQAEAPMREAKELAENQKREQTRLEEAQRRETEVQNRQREKKQQESSDILNSIATGTIIGLFVGTQKGNFRGDIFGMSGLVLGVMIGICVGLYIGINPIKKNVGARSTGGDFMLGAQAGGLTGGIVAIFAAFSGGPGQDSLILWFLATLFFSILVGLTMAVFMGGIGGIIGIVVGAIMRMVNSSSDTRKTSS